MTWRWRSCSCAMAQTCTVPAEILYKITLNQTSRRDKTFSPGTQPRFLHHRLYPEYSTPVVSYFKILKYWFRVHSTPYFKLKHHDQDLTWKDYEKGGGLQCFFEDNLERAGPVMENGAFVLTIKFRHCAASSYSSCCRMEVHGGWWGWPWTFWSLCISSL